MKALLLTLLAFSQMSLAQTISEDRPELEVQRREFEKHLYSKIDSALESILDKGLFILDVSVNLKRLPAEVIDLGSEGSSPDRFPLNAQREFDGAEGLVPLAKIGVWEAGQIEKRKRTYTRQIRRFTDLVDSVNVAVYLDPEKVTPAQKKSIEVVVQAIVRSSSPVTPRLDILDLKISYPKKSDLDLKTELVSEIKKEVESEILKAKEGLKEKQQVSWVSEFKIPLAIAFTTVVLFVLGLIMNRRQALHDNRRLQLDEEISKRQEEQLRSTVAHETNVVNATSGGLAPVGGGGPTDSDLAKNATGGFDHFIEIVRTEPARAGYLLKQWIYSEDTLSQSALAVLPRLISLVQLNQVLMLLTEADRKEWNRLINKPLGNFRYSDLDSFVARSIASNMVEPSTDIDDETRQLLATLTPHEAADCIIMDKSLGVLLVSTLPSLQVSRIFTLLDVQRIRDVAQSSANVEKSQLKYLSLKLQQTVTKVRSQTKAQSSIFIDRVPELLRQVGFAKEPALFDSVALTRNAKLLNQIAREYFPAELVLDLPTDFLKLVFDKLPLAERAELVFSQSPEIKKKLNQVVGVGRLKDVIDMEIEEIEANESRKRNILRSGDRIWQAFVDKVRDKIVATPDISHEVESIVDAWAQGKISEVSSGGGRAAA